MSRDVIFTPSAQMYVAAAKLCFRHQIAARRFWMRMAALVGCVMLIVVVAVLAMGGAVVEAVMAACAAALYGVAGLSIIVIGNYLLLPRRQRRLFAQDRTIGRSTRFSWNDEGTCWESDRGSYRAGWQDHHDVACNADVLLFFANAQLYRFVPLPLLTAEQRAELIARVEVVARKA